MRSGKKKTKQKKATKWRKRVWFVLGSRERPERIFNVKMQEMFQTRRRSLIVAHAAHRQSKMQATT